MISLIVDIWTYCVIEKLYYKQNVLYFSFSQLELI